MKPKYAVGDLVEFAGQQAKITGVHEEDYFFGHAHLYYTYDLQFVAGGEQKGVTEPALSLLHRANNATVNSRLCECGAWAIHWATNEHSRWCPAFNLFKPRE